MSPERDGFERRDRTTGLALVAAFALAASAGTPSNAGAAGVPPPPGEKLPAFEKASEDFRAGRFTECRMGFSGVARAAARATLAARASYAAACCAAQAGDLDTAFSELGFATLNGFHEVERALTDPRLEPLAGDPRWLAFLKRAEERRIAHEAALEPNLLRLYNELQAERAGRPLGGGGSSTTGTSAERAAARRAETLALVKRRAQQRPEDYLHAATLLAESADLQEVELARTLALGALELDPDLLAARPLVAAIVDRELVLLGRPQKFGTQPIHRDGKWSLGEVDPEVTDTDRAAWGVPPITESRARLAGLPAPPS